jgi:hypothetical protein
MPAVEGRMWAIFDCPIILFLPALCLKKELQRTGGVPWIFSSFHITNLLE